MEREKDAANREPAERIKKESFLERVEQKRNDRDTRQGPLSADEFLAQSERTKRDQPSSAQPGGHELAASRESSPRGTEFAAERIPPAAAMPVKISEPRPEPKRATAPSGNIPRGDSEGPLFVPEEAEDFRVRWNSVRNGFVDDPRKSVEQADALVEYATRRMAELLTEERNNLQKQWNPDAACTTDHLRLLLQRYHSFFERLLTV